MIGWKSGLRSQQLITYLQSRVMKGVGTRALRQADAWLVTSHPHGWSPAIPMVGRPSYPWLVARHNMLTRRAREIELQYSAP
jgi:hypothetical protein